MDVSLTKGDRRIACEISITTSPEHEIGNIQKCLAAGYDTVIVLAQDKKHVNKLRGFTQEHIESELLVKIEFFVPEDFVAFLDQQEVTVADAEKTLRGYKVKMRYSSIDEAERKRRRDAVATVIMKSMKI